MKAEPNSFQIDPVGNPIPPGFRVFIGGSRSGQFEVCPMPEDGQFPGVPDEYVYGKLFSHDVATGRATYHIRWRAFSTANKMQDVTLETVQSIVGNEAVDWVVSAEDWMESQGM